MRWSIRCILSISRFLRLLQTYNTECLAHPISLLRYASALEKKNLIFAIMLHLFLEYPLVTCIAVVDLVNAFAMLIDMLEDQTCNTYFDYKSVCWKRCYGQKESKISWLSPLILYNMPFWGHDEMCLHFKFISQHQLISFNTFGSLTVMKMNCHHYHIALNFGIFFKSWWAAYDI